MTGPDSVTLELLTDRERELIGHLRKTLDEIVGLNLNAIITGLVIACISIIALVVLAPDWLWTGSPLGLVLGVFVSAGITGAVGSWFTVFRQQRRVLFERLDAIFGTLDTRSALWKLRRLEAALAPVEPALKTYGLLSDPGNLTIRRRVLKLFREASV